MARADRPGTRASGGAGREATDRVVGLAGSLITSSSLANALPSRERRWPGGGWTNIVTGLHQDERLGYST
ncbi:MAG TPA: hypothetical protein VF940_22820 [Streptosporangiaceae bacterium]